MAVRVTVAAAAVPLLLLLLLLVAVPVAAGGPPRAHPTRETMLAWHAGAREEVAAEAERLVRALDRAQDAMGLDAARYARLRGLLRHTYTFSIDHALRVFDEDNSTFVVTGDIEQMWHRDSTVQFGGYLDLVRRLRLRGGDAAGGDGNNNAGSSYLARVCESVLHRQVMFILDDPYASAFYPTTGPGMSEGPTKNQCPQTDACPTCQCAADTCAPPCGRYAYQRNFELDSPLFVLLAHIRYWRAAGTTAHVATPEFAAAARAIIDVCETEQAHHARSPYRFPEPGGRAVRDGVGLVWSYARPSDDAVEGGYSVADNMMLVAVFAEAVAMFEAVGLDAGVVARYRAVAAAVDAAIRTHATTTLPDGREAYVYETDAQGHAVVGDDANMPNLLWMPYIRYPDALGLYNATRAASLSRWNPHYFKGRAVEGLGSAHASHGLRPHAYGPECYRKCVWHMGLIMAGRTADARVEKLRVLEDILDSVAGQSLNLLHEGFDADRPSEYNRDWFGWANALFAEWMREDWIEHYEGEGSEVAQRARGVSAVERVGHVETHAPTAPRVAADDLRAALAAAQQELVAVVNADLAALHELSAAPPAVPPSARLPPLNHDRIHAIYAQALPHALHHRFHIFPGDRNTIYIAGTLDEPTRLRDAAIQLLPYISVARGGGDSPGRAGGAPTNLMRVVEAAFHRLVLFIVDDPYASAFAAATGPSRAAAPNKLQCPQTDACPTCRCSAAHCAPACGRHVHSRAFELSGPLFVLLAHIRYWRAAGTTAHVATPEFAAAARAIIDVCETEQAHHARSPYRFPEPGGRAVRDGVGLVWSYARPSDDAVEGGYSVADNMMLVAVFAEAVAMFEAVGLDAGVVARYRAVAAAVDAAIQTLAVVPLPAGQARSGEEQVPTPSMSVYATEVDGFGGNTTCADAGIAPNLLSIPLWVSGGAGADAAARVYSTTRAECVLSRRNRYRVETRALKGTGGRVPLYDNAAGCRQHCVYLESIILEGMTASSRREKEEALRGLLKAVAPRAARAGGTTLHDALVNAQLPGGGGPALSISGVANALFVEWMRRDWIEGPRQGEGAQKGSAIATTVQSDRGDGGGERHGPGRAEASVSPAPRVAAGGDPLRRIGVADGDGVRARVTALPPARPGAYRYGDREARLARGRQLSHDGDAAALPDGGTLQAVAALTAAALLTMLAALCIRRRRRRGGAASGGSRGSGGVPPASPSPSTSGQRATHIRTRGGAG